MKSGFIKTLFVCSFVAVLMACDDNMGKHNTSLTEVKTLLEPIHERSFVLDPTAVSSIYFEWDYADAATTGAALYQLVFDKPDGDFSSPVYVVSSDNNGYYNHASITHKQMNKIARMAGINSSETGTFKWTVFSSKGEKTMKAAQENSIVITRMAGFEEDQIPIEVYVAGEGAEGGADLSKAPMMKSTSVGEFEAYTYLSAGKPFYFTDKSITDPKEFSTFTGLIYENGYATVETDGVYRIILDFTTGACSYTLVTRVGFYFSPSGSILFDLPYIGYGIFEAKQQTVTFKQESWGRDQRYKFRMFVKENGGADPEKELEWVTLNNTDSAPTSTSPESYYYVRLLTSLTQWDNKWKLMSNFDGVPADYTLYLTAGQPYTHSVSN